MNTIWSFFTRHAQFGFVVLFVLSVLGTISIFGIPKESTPEVDVPVVIVSTVFPGASAEEVESLITNELERPLRAKLDNVKEITSTSSEGISVISIEFTASADLDESFREARDEVDIARTGLPEDALDPVVTRINFADEPVVTATLSANVPLEILYRIAEDLEKELEEIPGVASVRVSGVPEKQTFVIVRPEVLTRYGLTAEDVSRALASANVTLPAGSIVRNGASYAVRVEGELATADDVGAVLITQRDGTSVFVRDVATVIDGRVANNVLSYTSKNGELSAPSVSFDVFKSSGTNITDVSARTTEKLTELQTPGALLDGVSVLIMFDRGELLRSDLGVLVNSGLQTVFLVTLVLALAVGVREALIAAVSIPFSFVVAFIGLYYSGNTINFVSLFALILSIGIIVDASIVMIEDINKRLSAMAHPEHETPNERLRIKIGAALDSIRDFHSPLTAGTLTTVAVFAPLFLVSGITGEFISSIPFTILFVLSASLIVALGFVPLIASRFLKRGHTQNPFDTYRTRLVQNIESLYRTYLTRVLAEKTIQHTFVGTVVVLFILSVSLPVLGAVRVAFFESNDAEYVFAEVEMSPGTRLEETLKKTKEVEALLYTIPEIESFVTTVGSTSQFGNTTGGSSSSEKFANIFIALKKDRARTSAEIITAEREKFADVQGAEVRFSELEDGPPSLAPITITLTSERLEDLDIASRRIAQALKDLPGATDVTTSVTEPPVEYVIAIDRARAAALGIVPSSIAVSVRNALYGTTATELRSIDENKDVIVQTTISEGTDPRLFTSADIDAVAAIPLLAPGTQTLVPLSTVADIGIQAGRESIVHKDGDRIATVSSRVAEGGNALVISEQLKAQVPELDIPTSVVVSFGGESEDVDQSFRDMFVALFLGLVGMFAIILLEFDSIRHTGYILLTVPLALIGVFIGLMITGSPLSFPSMMGFIALAGIVVNNAIILIDVFNSERTKLREEEETPEKIREIVLEGSVSRLRPVILTALTTVIGIVPLLWTAEIWVPLVYAMAFGLTFSTLITLVFIPILYARYPGSLPRID